MTVAIKVSYFKYFSLNQIMIVQPFHTCVKNLQTFFLIYFICKEPDGESRTENLFSTVFSMDHLVYSIF